MEVAASTDVSSFSLNRKTMSKKEMYAFLIGMLGQNVIYNITGASLTYFFQFTLLIPATTVAVMVAIARVWDALNDPMMGTIVDRTRTRWGKCRPYLIFVPVPIMIITVLNYVNFGFYGVGSGSTPAMKALIVGWAGTMYILWGMSYTIGDIPLWGITALLTEDDVQRNKLMGLARVVGGIGGGIVLLGMQPLALAIGNAITQKIGISRAGGVAEWQAILDASRVSSEMFKEALASGVPYDKALVWISDPNPILEHATRQGERYGFLIIAAILAVIGTALFQVVGLNVREKIEPSKEKYNLADNFKIMWRNKPFRKILVSGVLGSPKMLLMMASMPLITYYFASKDPTMAFVYMLILGGGLFAGNLGIMAFAQPLTKKWSKKQLYNWGNALGIPPFLAVFFMYLAAPAPVGLTAWYWVLISFFVFLIAGASMGITTVMQTFMIADCVDYEEYTNGVRPDGVFFSGQTFIAKITSGIATMLSGIIYSIYKFSDANVQKVNDYVANGLIPREIPEFEPYMKALFVMVSIPPAIGCLLSILPMINYELTDKRAKEILEELIVRRQKAQEELVDTAKVAIEATGDGEE